MDYKPKSDITSNATNTPGDEPRTPDTPSSAQIRKDVDRATGKVADAAKNVKDQAVDKAKEAKEAKGETTDAVQEVKGEVVDAAKDAKDKAGEVIEETKQTASRVADKVKETGDKAIEAAKGYAAYAVDATGQKVRDVQERFEVAKSTASDYIHEDPVRAVTYAAIGSAVLTAALIGIFRRR